MKNPKIIANPRAKLKASADLRLGIEFDKAYIATPFAGF